MSAATYHQREYGRRCTAARISYNLLRVSSSEGVTVGPVLMGVAKPVHVLTPIASVRRIVNMVALAVVEAQTQPL